MRLFLTSLILVMTCGIAQAQFSKVKEYNWGEPITHIPSIDEQFSESNALILERRVGFRQFPSKGNFAYKTEISVYKRIYIKNDSGAEENGRIILDYDPKDEVIISLDCRTIKPNKTVVDFNLKDLKIVDFNSRTNKDDKRKELRIQVPGVEEGDIVEVVYVAEIEALRPYQEFYFHDSYPVLLSKLTVELDRRIGFSLLGYNGVPEEKEELTAANIRLNWVMENLPANYAPYSCKACHLPHVKYATRTLKYSADQVQEISQNNVGNFLKSLDRWMDQKHTNSKKSDYQYYQAFIKRHTVENDKIATMINLHNYLNDSIKIVPVSDENAASPFGVYLRKKEMPYKALFTLYNTILDDFGIPYFYGFTKSKYDGPWDENLISLSQVEDLFFALETDKGFYFFLPKSNTYQYYFTNEFPFYITGTKAYVVTRPSRSSTKADYFPIFMPPSVATDNVSRIQRQLKINTDENKVSLSEKRILTGEVATYGRTYFNTLLNEVEAEEKNKSLQKEFKGFSVSDIQVTKKENMYPFTYTISAAGASENLLTSLEDNIYSLSLDNLVQHMRPYGLDKQNRSLPFIPMYVYNDFNNLFLIFDKPVEILNKEKLAVELSDENVKISLTLTQMNPTMVRVDSAVEINAQEIALPGFDFYEKFVEEFNQLNSRTLLFKTL
ncbi:MAG: DUF3857 domain-containing protein [Luteibaculaceae bacterium]